MQGVALLSSAAWRELSGQDKFRRYLSALGLPTHQSDDQAEQRLRGEFPTEWKHFQAAVKRRGAGELSDDIYELKNQNLRFSLLATLLERRELHAQAFYYLEKHVGRPQTILDVGCENGFLTCLLALRWPEARVTGLDRVKAGIDRASELASNLKLRNVTFEVGTVGELQKIVGSQSFDLITTITVLHDGGLLPPLEERNRRNADAFSPMKNLCPSAGLSAIGSALGRSGAQWVSLERCCSPATFSAWCQAIDSCGPGIDYSRSGRIHSQRESLAVVAAAYNQPRPIDLKRLHGAWIASDFNRWTPNEPPWVLRDQQAEAIFAQISPKICIDRIVAFDGHGREVKRIEVWEADTICLYYIATQPGEETKLQFRAITDLLATRDHWKAQADSLRQSAPPDARFEELHQTC